MMPQTPSDAINTILEKLGREHLQQIQARNSHPKGSSTWHRFDQGRWAFREAALIVDRSTGHSHDIYGEWLEAWSPEDADD